MKDVAFIGPPQPDVIESILQHCGLWQSRSSRAPPEVNDPELDAAFADSSLESADQADPSQELACVDIDMFLANFSRVLDVRQQGTLRPGFGIAPYFACIEGPVALRQAPIWLPATRNGRRALVFQGGRARPGTQALLESFDPASLPGRLRRN